MRTVQIFFIGYLCTVILFLAHFYLVGSAVYGDGRYYYSYLPTFFVQHTLNFSQSYQYFHISGPITPKELVGNVYAIGPASFWALPYLFSYIVFAQGNPYDLFLQIIVGLWNCAAVWLGLYILFRSLLKFFSKQIALLATLTTALTTNLLFYGSLDVINSHSAGFFFACLLFSLLLEAPTKKRAFLEGLLIGALALMRIQDGIFLFLPITLFLIKQQKKIFFTYTFFTILGFSLVLSPQLILWQYMWENALKSPYLYTNSFNFLSPQIIGVLFNRGSGLFLWTPSILIALGGLFFFYKKNKLLSILFFSIFLLQLYIIASWNIWWEGASYSARMLITTLPFLACGFGAFFERLLGRQKIFFILIFTFYNLFAILFFLWRSN